MKCWHRWPSPVERGSSRVRVFASGTVVLFSCRRRRRERVLGALGGLAVCARGESDACALAPGTRPRALRVRRRGALAAPAPRALRRPRRAAWPPLPASFAVDRTPEEQEEAAALRKTGERVSARGDQHEQRARARHALARLAPLRRPLGHSALALATSIAVTACDYFQGSPFVSCNYRSLLLYIAQ